MLLRYYYHKIHEVYVYDMLLSLRLMWNAYMYCYERITNKRIDAKLFLKYIFMLKPKQLFIIIYVNVCTKQTIKSCSVTEKIRKWNFPSHDWDFDDRIRHLNHLLLLIVLSSKVNNLPFWKFEFSQERRCHDNVIARNDGYFPHLHI